MAVPAIRLIAVNDPGAMIPLAVLHPHPPLLAPQLDPLEGVRALAVLIETRISNTVTNSRRTRR
jgi:hypothetical protein